MMRANVAGTQLAEKDFLTGIKRMRIELLNRKNYVSKRTSIIRKIFES